MPKKEPEISAEQKVAAPEAEETKGKKKKKRKKDGQDIPEGGKKPRFKRLIKKILILLLVAVLIGLGVCIYFDWLNLRTGMMDLLCKIGPEGKTYTATLQERQVAIEQLEADFAIRQEELRLQEEALIKEEERLARLAENLNELDATLNQQQIAQTPVYREDLSEEKLAELKNLGKIYSNMNAEAASMILPQLYGAADMASIIFYMDKAAAAELLATLSPELSAQITTEMLRE